MFIVAIMLTGPGGIYLLHELLFKFGPPTHLEIDISRYSYAVFYFTLLIIIRNKLVKLWIGEFIMWVSGQVLHYGKIIVSHWEHLWYMNILTFVLRKQELEFMTGAWTEGNFAIWNEHFVHDDLRRLWCPSGSTASMEDLRKLLAGDDTANIGVNVGGSSGLQSYDGNIQANDGPSLNISGGIRNLSGNLTINESGELTGGSLGCSTPTKISVALSIGYDNTKTFSLKHDIIPALKKFFGMPEHWCSMQCILKALIWYRKSQLNIYIAKHTSMVNHEVMASQIESEGKVLFSRSTIINQLLRIR
jgi:hypothetical protein